MDTVIGAVAYVYPVNRSRQYSGLAKEIFDTSHGSKIQVRRETEVVVHRILKLHTGCFGLTESVWQSDRDNE